MATKLRKKELKIIAYFLGVTSKDIITCKLICKSWNLYFTQIIPNKIEDDETEEEKSYIPSNYNRNTNMKYNTNTNTIHIQRSQPVMVTQHRIRNKPNNMIMSKEYKEDFEDHKSQISSANTSPSINPISKQYGSHSSNRRRINPSDFLKHSLDRAFWRLDQNTLDKMIASGNSPHIKGIKITQINDGLLTEKEKKYIEKERKHKYKHEHKINDNISKTEIVHKSSSYVTYITSPPIKHKMSDYIPSNTQLLHTPNIINEEYNDNNNKNSISDTTNTMTPILKPSSLKSNDDTQYHRKNDAFGSNSLYIDKLQTNEMKQEQKYNRNEVENMLATSVKWKPQYPLHLLQNDKSYKRHAHQQQHKKRKHDDLPPYNYHKQTDTFSTCDSQTDTSDLIHKQSDHKITKSNEAGSIQTNKKLIKIHIPFSRSLTVNKLKEKKSKKQLSAQSKSGHKRINESKNKKEQPLLSTMFDPETFESTVLSPQQSIPMPKQRIHKKKKKNPISRFLHASQPISQSVTKKHKNLAFLSPASSLYSETDEFRDQLRFFDDHYDNDYRANNAELQQMINEGPVKDISFLPPSLPKQKDITSDLRNVWGSDIGTTTDDDLNEDVIVDIEFKENDQEYIELADEDEVIKNNGDLTSLVGSNLSKSLLLNSNNRRARLGTDDSLYYHGNHNTNIHYQRKRGYTTDSADLDAIYSRQIITPYELRKQHSQLRIIDNRNNQKIKPSPSLLIGINNNKNKNKQLDKGLLMNKIDTINSIRSRGMSTISVNSNVMTKLMGPLYSEEEKSNWNDMKKVDHKYENILKKRRKKIMVNKKTNIAMGVGVSPHFRNNNVNVINVSSPEDTMTITTQNTRNTKSSFWGNLYDWILGDKSVKDNVEIEASTQHTVESHVTNSTTTTATTSNDYIGIDRTTTVRTSGNVLTSPLLMDVGDGVQIKQNLEALEKKREIETTQISFWKDIVIPNWDLLYKTSVVKLFWEREGIPKTCRGQVWYYAIGNKLNIPSNSFENIYKVNKEEIEEFIEFMENQQNINNNMINNNEINAIKSILGGNNISTRSILNVTPKKNKKIVNEAGQTVNFCEGLKRKNSIERDISRLFGSDSFEDLVLNSIDKKHEHIACVLMAFCNCRKSIGYIQFMTHLVQILLKYQSPKVAFISLCNMLNTEIFEIYIHCNVSEIRQRIEIFTKMLVYNSSEIARHLQKLSILADTYVMDWCNGLFSAQLPLNIVSRIWDLYFLHGEIIIWKCSVALLILLNENLNITKKSHHKIVKILQSIKKSLSNHNIILKEEEFVKKIYYIKLPRDVRKWFKRKELSRKNKGKRRKKRKHRYKHHPKHQKHQHLRDRSEKHQKGKLNKKNINHAIDKN